MARSRDTGPEDILSRVDAIRRQLGKNPTDHEVAHGMEDELHRDVLTAIATGGHSRTVMQRMAEAALLTTQLDIKRWMA